MATLDSSVPLHPAPVKLHDQTTETVMTGVEERMGGRGKEVVRRGVASGRGIGVIRRRADLDVIGPTAVVEAAARVPTGKWEDLHPLI